MDGEGAEIKHEAWFSQTFKDLFVPFPEKGGVTLNSFGAALYIKITGCSI